MNNQLRCFAKLLDILTLYHRLNLIDRNAYGHENMFDLD